MKPAFAARYVSRCGRAICSSCNGADGSGGKTWAKRMCQYGTQKMSLANIPYRDILRHYYGNIQFSDEGGTMPNNPGEITIDKYLRPVDNSRLGLHWTPIQGHTHSDLTYFINRAADMGMRWVTLLDDGGGSTLQPSTFYDGNNIVDMFMEVGIIPIIRIFCHPLAKFDARFEDTSRRLVARGVRWIFGPNEPECNGEWKHLDPPNSPADYVHSCTRNFVNWAYKLKALGAYPGFFATTTGLFTDENGIRVNPFLEYMSEQERDDIFIHGHGWIPIHNYPKNHPLDFPGDAVNQFGKQLTDAEYQAKLDEVDATYRQVSGDLWVWDSYQTDASHINFVRDRGINSGATIDDDDVCFRMYQGMNRLLGEAGLLPYVPIISTEIGPCIGNREDGRYARTTPQEQIRMIDAMLEEANQVPNYFGMTIWLAGVQRLDASTADGFEDQSLWTDRHNDPFDLDGEIPLVQHLIDNPGGGELPPPEPIEPPEEPMPEPILRWLIPDWNDAENLEVLAEPGTTVWKLIRAEIAPDNMANTVWIHVLDEQGQATQAPVIVQNVNGDEFTLPHKVGEPYNQPMFKNDKLMIFIGDSEISDIVSNIHGAYWDEPGVNAFHVGYILTFQEWAVPGDEDPLESPEPPLPQPISEEDIIEAAWNNIYPMGGIRWNPEASFQVVARIRSYGAPCTQEIDVGGYRFQGFSGGILYCLIGEWDRINGVDW